MDIEARGPDQCTPAEGHVASSADAPGGPPAPEYFALLALRHAIRHAVAVQGKDRPKYGLGVRGGREGAQDPPNVSLLDHFVVIDERDEIPLALGESAVACVGQGDGDDVKDPEFCANGRVVRRLPDQEDLGGGLAGGSAVSQRVDRTAPGLPAGGSHDDRECRRPAHACPARRTTRAGPAPSRLLTVSASHSASSRASGRRTAARAM